MDTRVIHLEVHPVKHSRLAAFRGDAPQLVAAIPQEKDMTPVGSPDRFIRKDTLFPCDQCAKFPARYCQYLDELVGTTIRDGKAASVGRECPRVNLVRYHGVLAPSAAWRPIVIPSEPEPEIAAPSFHPTSPAKEQILSGTENLQNRRAPKITELASHPSCSAKKQIPENLQKKRTCRPRNYSWAQLMTRVLRILEMHDVEPE
ncbi:MAG: hypothetical protein H6Q05_3976 [Acidobacteria bacterium]|nr:hypothetical protein [Acidobacteriota bacterium]